MPNIGKPSTGCHMCRARRIKCDEEKPHCKRCQKSKRICPGYRDWSELTLRNNNKSKMKEASPSRGLSTPIGHQAACYFITHFVTIQDAGPSRGYLDFIVPLLGGVDPSPSLSLAFSAVTFVAFEKHINSNKLVPKAKSSYVKALKEINLTLQDPKKALDDATVASALLLAKFEEFIPSQMMHSGWNSHMNGATALLKARGKKLCQTPYGRDLFISIREQVMLVSIANQQVPDPGLDWLGMVTEDPVSQTLINLYFEMAKLLEDNNHTTTLSNRTPQDVEQVLSLMRRAEALEQKFLDWTQTLPASWKITSTSYHDMEIENLSTAPVHPGRVDSFQELWMAYKYNASRSCRLLISTTIIRCVAWLGGPTTYSSTTEYGTASKQCRSLIEDIIASIPYFFGCDPSLSDAANNGACRGSNMSLLKGRAGFFLLWPLFAAATSDFATDTERCFLNGKLQLITDILGINQATIALSHKFRHPSMLVQRDCLKHVYLPHLNVSVNLDRSDSMPSSNTVQT